MFEKVEHALAGKKAGEQIKVTLTPDEGFGYPDPSLIFTDDIQNVPDEYRQIGARPTFQNDKGDTREMLVTKIENDKITIDGNHPFAGKTITFIVDVIEVHDESNSNLDSGLNYSPESDSLH